jgi:LPS-assembly lipoprotein
MIYRKWAGAASVWVLMILITSCGFHLRGVLDMPPWLNQVTIVLEKTHHDVGTHLKNQLEGYHVHLITNPLQAKYLLLVRNDSFQQQITNVAASTTTRQYQLIYRVEFSLIRANGEIIIPPTVISVTRNFIRNNDRVLSSNWVEGLLDNEMRRDAVMQIISRLSRGK